MKGSDLKKEGNVVTITVLEGSWILFDRIALAGGKMSVADDIKDIFLREVSAADYEIVRGKERFQPLLVDVEHLSVPRS